MLQSETRVVSAAEVTSHDGWYTAATHHESSAFRRLGCARLWPVNTLMGSAGPCNFDDPRHTAAVDPQQRDHELSALVTVERTDECCEPPTQSDRKYATASAGLDDKVANVSVHFPCSPSSVLLARQLRAMRRNNRRIAATDERASFAPHPNSFTAHSSLDKNDHRVSSFDDLPDSLVACVFSSGLDSYELCRCALVCRRWNTLVWNAARLWTTVDFDSCETLDVDEALRTVTRALSRKTPPLCLGVEQVKC